MSCSLVNFGLIEDIPATRSYLFPQLKEDEEVKSAVADGWDDADWDFDDVDLDVKGKVDTDNIKETWLQECCISLSPSHDILAIAYKQRAVFLTQKWDVQESGGTGSKYRISFKGHLNHQEGECVSSLLCVPLVSQKTSSHGGPDWTCIMVGFTSGCIRMYTENGALLISQLLHEERVLKLKCRTYELPRHSGIAEQIEELTILYPKALVTIDGFSLFQSLRACRNQVARAAASGSDVIQLPPLAYKKWGLQEQERITDHVSAGVITPCSFNQMETASILGGYKASIKTSPPAASKYLTTGIGPFVGVYYALEGSTQPLLSDVAAAVASKLKSALFSQFSAASGWLGFKSPTGDQSDAKKKPKVEPATSLPIRFGLPDLRRHGDSITLSPSRTLAVTTDSFGRVILIDVNRGHALRMWKGYRDAQCGWIQVLEDVSDKVDAGLKRRHRGKSYTGRVALFLVIYAPRRGIVEVWNTQQGPRVAAFNVSKYCRFLCPGYYIMGLNRSTAKTANPPPYQCCLIQPDGYIRTFTVPFHLALSDKNSKRARDLHLLKKVISYLNNQEIQKDEESLVHTLLDMKIASLRQQALERILSAKIGLKPALIMRIVSDVAEQINSQDVESRDYESKCLLRYCNVQLQLLYSYNAIDKAIKMTAQSPDGATQGIEQDLISVLNCTKSEVEYLLNLLNDYQQDSHRPRVHFQEDHILDTAGFISCFDMNCYHHGDIVKHSDDDNDNDDNAVEESSTSASMSQIPVYLFENLSEEQHVQLGVFLFGNVLAGSSSVNDVSMAIKSVGLSANTLMSTLLCLWLSTEHHYYNDLSSLQYLKELIYDICHMVDEKQTKPPVDAVSPWWQSIRDILSQSTNVGAALTAAMVTRSVAMGMVFRDHNSSGKRKDVEEKHLDEETEKDCDESEMECSVASPDKSPDPSPDKSPDKSSDKSPDTESLISEGWVSISVDMELWNLLVHQLEDVTTVKCLLLTKPSKIARNQASSSTKAWTSSQDFALSINSEDLDISVHKFLNGGKGIVAEVIARWVAKYCVPHTILDSIHPMTNSFEKHASYVPMVTKDTAVQDELNQISGLLSSLRKRFPISLQPDLLYAHCTWEYIVSWNKQTEITEYLQEALLHLNSIKNTVLQHGIAYMMWHTFLVKKVSSAAYLMEKVGKAPKDRLCRRDIGLSETALPKFMDIVCDLISKIYQIEPEASIVPTFEIEDNWEKIEGPTSIAELAIDQPLCNYALVDLHKQLCTILNSVLAFYMRSVKPLSLFNSKGRNALFKDLNSNPPLPSHDVDVSLLNSRQKFLCRVITASVGTVELMEDSSTRHVSLEWPLTIIQLGMALNVDVDLLKRHYVYQLYGSGYDAMAQEVLHTVHEHAEMGVLLLRIVGYRLAHLVVNPDAAHVEKLSRLPVPLVAWIKGLDESDVRNVNIPLTDTAILIGHIVNQLPENHPLYSLSVQLVEAIDALR